MSQHLAVSKNLCHSSEDRISRLASQSARCVTAGNGVTMYFVRSKRS